MKGVHGKYLDIDLSSEKISDYKVPEEWYRKYLGGRGIGARIMVEELEVGVDPLGPQNVLLFATGPLQGTAVPGAGRHMAMAKSPKTGGVSGSYSGGLFGHELGNSGYDGIIVRGKANSPVYISLEGGKGTINDAGDLWGKETGDVDEELKSRHDGGRVAGIGIAGENLVKFACIINDRNRASGRPGFGAVMGSKNLKAVLAKGSVGKQLENEERFNEIRSDYVKVLTPVLDWGKYGTTGTVGGLNEMGILPTKNFQEGVFEGAEKINGDVMYDVMLTERDTCTGCPVRCKRVVRTEFDGEEVEERYGGPEYETLAAFGSLCLNDNLDSIALANQKCNAYGLDTISAGVSVAFAMEASEKGLIDEDVKWGDPKAVVDLVDKVARREGIGDDLARGIDQLADEIGADFDMQVKGQEIPMHEPRGKSALAISYATSPRGANHMEIIHDAFSEHLPEIDLDDPIDRFDLAAKPEYCNVYENLISFTDTAIICSMVSWVAWFSDNTYPYPEMRELIGTATGVDFGKDEMLRIGERNFNLLKILSAREGITREADGLPKRFENPLPRGPSADNPIPEEELQKRIDEYYEIRGWDEFGPTREKLEELDMLDLDGQIKR